MNAARLNDLPRVHKLLKGGAYVNEQNSAGDTALYEAIERLQPSADNLPVAQALLEAGADPNQTVQHYAKPLELSFSRDYANPKVTALLISKGAYVSKKCTSPPNSTPLLIVATEMSSTEVMQALISKGSPVNCIDSKGQTALFKAAEASDAKNE